MRQCLEMMQRPLAIVVLVSATFLSCAKEPPLWSPLPLGTSADFRDVVFADANNGWIAGGAHNIAGGLIGRTKDGGRTWDFSSGIISPHPHANGRKIESLYFFDASYGLAATDGGKIYTTSDGGDNWAEVRPWTGATDYLFDIDFIDESRGWTVGLGGIVRTDDGGETWSMLAKKVGEERITVRAGAFLDQDRGWIVGHFGTAMRTEDGGTTWTRVEMPGVPEGQRLDFWDVFFIDETRGWICGEEGTLLHTTDGGETWSVVPLGIDGVRSAPKLETIPKPGGGQMQIDAGDRTPGLTLASVQFVDANRGWIVGFFANMGRSQILATQDGGKTWSVEADIEGEELRALHVLDADHAWAIGARTRPGDQAIFYRGPSSRN